MKYRVVATQQINRSFTAEIEAASSFEAEKKMNELILKDEEVDWDDDASDIEIALLPSLD